MIFGIIALVQKQKKWLAIAWVVVGGIVTAITIAIVIVWSIFLRNNAETIVKPVVEIWQMIDEDQKLAEIMSDPTVKSEFEFLLRKRIEEKLWKDFGTKEWDQSRNEIKSQLPVIFEEIKSTMLELKEKYSVK